MKTLLRNFLSVQRRFKLATLLNVFGLAVAFAAFMVILMQIDYDRTFDHFHKNADCIYRFEIGQENQPPTAVVSRPLAELFTHSSSQIEAGALMEYYIAPRVFSVESNGNKNIYKEETIQVTPSFTDVFDFTMTEGSAKALTEPDHILIPQSLAQKLFQSESAIGRQLITQSKTWTVGGVYRDFPRNTFLKNAIIQAIPETDNKDKWENSNYFLFIRTSSPDVKPSEVIDQFKRNTDPKVIFQKDITWEKAKVGIRLTSIKELHFVTDARFDNSPKANRMVVFVFMVIALVILLIAGINYMNFSTALTPMRVRSINTQKVLGSSDRSLRLSLLLEAIIISGIAYLISLLFLYFLPLTPVNELVDADLALSAHPAIMSITAALALLLGFLAGLYPSYYVTSFPPALVLKGNFGLSPSGRKLRNVLISLQFIASFALIICAIFMSLQNQFMQKTPLGYDRDELLVSDVSKKLVSSREAFSRQMESYAEVEGVSFGEQLLSSSDQYMGWGRDYHNQNINFQCLPVEPGFLKVMGIPVIEGRDFREEDKLTKYGALIFNEMAKKQYDLKVGESIDSMEIAGIMPDIKFASFRMSVSPMAFYVFGTKNWGTTPSYAYIRVKAGSDLRQAMAHLKETLATIDPDYPFNARFYDDVLNATYEKEGKTTALITLFSFVAIFISIVGVFGLTVFECLYRRKEIGIRKVFGASMQQVLTMFVWTYLRILCLCFVLAAPVAFLFVQRWLQNFAYKTPVSWWVFAVSFVVVALITLATVVFQSWRAASDNPLNSIKTE